MLKTPLLSLVLCLLLTSSCHARGSFVYVSNYGDGTISQFRANPNGTLTPLNPPAVKAWPRCHSIAVARGRFLYAVSSLEFSRRNCLVSQFRIKPDGRLTPLSPATVAVDNSPSLVTAEPSGRFVYVFGRSSNVAEFRVKPNGALASLNPPTVGMTSDSSNDCHVSYDRRHCLMYVSSYGHMMMNAFGGTGAFRIRRDGQLLSMPRSVSRDLVEGIYVTRSGRFAYVPLHYRDLYVHNVEAPKIEVRQYRITSDGRLLPLVPPLISSPLNPPQVGLPLTEKTILIHPKDRFCYLFSPNGYWVDAGTYNRRLVGSLSIAHCSIRPSGSLGRPLWQTFNLRDDVWDAAASPSGLFLYLLTGNGVRAFRVSHDGSVAPTSPHSARAGRGPLGLVYVQR